MTDTQKACAAEVQKMRMSEAFEKVKVETLIYEDKIRKQTELRGRRKNEILSPPKKRLQRMWKDLFMVYGNMKVP